MSYPLGLPPFRNSLLTSSNNKQFARWRYFTTTTRILFVFPFICELDHKSPNLHKKGKPWRILVVVVKWRHRANGLLCLPNWDISHSRVSTTQGSPPYSDVTLWRAAIARRFRLWVEYGQRSCNGVYHTMVSPHRCVFYIGDPTVICYNRTTAYRHFFTLENSLGPKDRNLQTFFSTIFTTL